MTYLGVMMIDPETIDLLMLPSFPLSKKLKLPGIAGIYFAIDSLGVVQYIGQSVNINRRWRCHHNQRELEALGLVRIAYVACPKDLLRQVESALIYWFSPPLNGGRVSYLTDCSMEVVRQVRAKAPNLPMQIKAAREASGSSVQQLATIAGISSAYWYQIENNQCCSISEETLKGIELALNIEFGVKFERNSHD